MTAIQQAQRIIDTHTTSLYSVTYCAHVLEELVSTIRLMEAQIELLKAAKVNEG